MGYSFFDHVEPEITTTKQQPDLKVLAEFIKAKDNADLLYKQNGEINFSNCPKPFAHFNANNEESLAILTNALEQYSTKLAKLQTVDFKLALSLTIGAVAIPLSPLMFGFGVLVSTAAFIYFGKMHEQRKAVQAEYKQAQAEMTSVYIWIMNDKKASITQANKALPKRYDGQSDEAYAQQLNNVLHPKIKQMHEIFNPMLSDQDILAYTRNDLETAITVDRNSNNEKNIKNESTTKLQLSRDYLIYGQDQGSAGQIATGIMKLFGQTLWNVGVSMKNAVVSATGIDEDAIKSKAASVAANAMFSK